MVKRKAKSNGAPESAETAEDKEPPPSKKGKWKAVEMDLDLMKEFESSGGCMLEEADEDEIGIAYANGA
eukprot:1567145-Amphidinium_carterae.1